MSWETLVPLGAFLAMALGTWGLLTAIAERQSRAADRLDRLVRGGAERRAGGSALLRRQDRIQALIQKAAPALSRPLRPKDEAEVGKLRLRLLNAGIRGDSAVHVYLGIKLVCLLVALAVGVPTALAHYGATQRGLFWIVAGGAIGFYLPSLVLTILIK